MKRVIYSSPFVPAEWIAAHGFSPCRMLPPAPAEGTGLLEAVPGVCPYMRGFVNCAFSEPGRDLVVLTTECDQMRRAADMLPAECLDRAYVMYVPTTWTTVEAFGLYVSELHRLGDLLAQRPGGRRPSAAELAEAMNDYDERRRRLRGLRAQLGDRAFSEAIAVFSRTGRLPAETGRSPVRPADRRVPLGMVGGPLTLANFNIFDELAAAGGEVVLDGTESGERTLPSPFDRRRLKDDPMLVLAEAYFGTIPDAFRRPNSALFEWLRRETRARDVRGLIVVRHLWCDTWHAEVRRIADDIGLPVLDMDLDGRDPGARRAGRIKAFMELFL